MSAPETAGKNVPKSNEVLPRVCGTRIFNEFWDSAAFGENDMV